ncbi:hypothetical protein [Vibrio ziniensis]|uniref:Lipoprotein n=1 Tax=Vibrio ziniensis TaxID=2711221 RepID=A0A6G7CN90_9VIBR|nr:hypothetical protein [Vibrio ziniensis]QIH43565.1 hypothetical protein G5S32_16355 [Vibrio ziniensis]
MRKEIRLGLLALIIGGCGGGDGGSNTQSATNIGVSGSTDIEGRWSAAYLSPYESPPVIDVSPRGVFILRGQEGRVDPDQYNNEKSFEVIGKFEGESVLVGTATTRIDPRHDSPDQGLYYETITITGQLDTVPTTLRFSSQYLFDDIDFNFTVKVNGNSPLMSVNQIKDKIVSIDADYYVSNIHFNEESLLVMDVYALSGNSEAPYRQNCEVTATVEPFQAAIGSGVQRHYYDVIQESTDCSDMLTLYAVITWNSDSDSIAIQTNHDNW